MVFALDPAHLGANQRPVRSARTRRSIQLAALLSLGLIPLLPLPHWSQESDAEAAILGLKAPEPTWFPTGYRAWKQSSAWKPENNAFIWDQFKNRLSCGSNQTCLPIKIVSREDCDFLSIAASLVNPSTGQMMLAKASAPTVPAGEAQHLTLRWNLPPGQANRILAREARRRTSIDTLADRAGNANLQALALAHVSSKLIPSPPPWQSVTIQEIRCL